MISGFGSAALALLFGYLALFFWGSAMAAQTAGKPVWLFARATGRDRLASMGFRAAFALAFFGPLLWLAVPMLHKIDPLWTEGRAVLIGLIGVFVAGLGAMVAFAARDWQQVRDFHAAALARGGRSEGEPGLRPHYNPDFFAAYVRDPDGNKLAAVCRGFTSEPLAGG